MHIIQNDQKKMNKLDKIEQARNIKQFNKKNTFENICIII